MDILEQELAKTKKDELNTKYTTALHKVHFANEIRGGLGQKIKAEPNKIKVIKKTRWQRFIALVKNFLNKF